jgi:hypothetical protein
MAQQLESSRSKAGGGGGDDALSSSMTMNVYGARGSAGPPAAAARQPQTRLPGYRRRLQRRQPRALAGCCPCCPAVLFRVLGFTAGAYAAGIPRAEVFWQQATAAGGAGPAACSQHPGR